MGENNIRKLKVYRSTNSNSSSDIPTIRLDGKWLQKYGFNTGDFIRVECKGGEIIIRKDTERIEEEAVANQQYTDMLSRMSKIEINALAKAIDQYSR